MSKELVVASNRHETKLAVLEDGELVEVYFQRSDEYSLVGSIHKGRVTRVLPGMQSAFVNIGLERDAFLYVSDFYEETGEDYERLGTQPSGGQASGQSSGQASGDDRRRGRGGRDRDRGDRNGDRNPDRNATDKGQDRGGDRPERVERPDMQARESGESDVEIVDRAAEPEVAAGGEAAATGDPAAPSKETREARDNDRRKRGRRRRRGGGRAGFPENKFAPAGQADDEPTDKADAADEEEAELHTARPETQVAAPPLVAPPMAAPARFAAPRVDDFEQIILPGESLAKYRNRPPVAPAPAAAPVAPAAATASVTMPAPTAKLAQVEPDIETAPPGTVVVDHHAAASQAVDEDDITEAIEDAVDARLDELQAAAESALDDDEGTLPPAVDLDEADDEDDAEAEAEAQAHLSGETEEEREAAAHLSEDGDQGEFGEDLEGSDAMEAAEDGDAEPAEGESAEVRDQPVARYIQPRPGGRRRRGRGRDRERGTREGREANPSTQPAQATPADSGDAAGDIETVARPGRERRPREERTAPPSIADMLKAGQEIIVQIAKEPISTKGARITSHVAIPGRFVVYMPTLDHHGVSRKVGTDEERARLKRLLQTHSEGMTGGFIVRTAGEGRTEEEVAADMSFLYNLWLDIRKKAEKKPAPALLHHDLELVQRILRDQMNDQFKSVWVDSEELYESIATFLERFQPAMASRLKLYTRPAPIFDAFNITSELEKALRPKVWLKSGGFIVINQTEALVAIDINTGKYVGRTSRLEDTIVKTNVEAVKEIVRQIRLRDLGGIIVVDFIDMEERRNRAKVMAALEEAMRADRAPYKILQFNDFGLVTITRRRVKQSLERALCTACPTCEGAGYVKSVDTVIGEILVEAHKIAKTLEGKEVMLRVHPEVAKVLKSNQHHFLEEVEEVVGKHVAVMADPLLHPEKFDMV